MAIQNLDPEELELAELLYQTKMRDSFGSGITTPRSVHQSVGAQTGVLSVDIALGGGLPCGITEVTGESSVGKTALLGSIISDTQQSEIPVALVAADYLDKPYLKNLGVNLSELVILPAADEEIIGLVLSFLVSADRVLLTIDALDGVRPQEEDLGAWNDLVFHLLDEVRSHLSVDSAAAVTTQVRTKRSIDPRRTFSRGTESSARRFTDLFDAKIELTRKEVGDYLYTMGVDVKKSGLGTPARYLEIPATKGHGIERELDVIRVAMKCGVLELRGPRMIFKDRFIGMGERGAAQLIMRDRQLLTEIYQGILR